MPASVRFPGTSNVLRVSLLAILLAVTASIPTMASQPATPVAEGESRLYLSHSGRFTAEVPATWTPDYSLANDLAGDGGFIGSDSVSSWDPSLATVESACDLVTFIDVQFGSGATMEETTWRDGPACIVRGDAGSANTPVALVFAHPEPAAGFAHEFIAVTTSAEHFDDITATISFDPGKVTAGAYLDAAIDSIEAWSIVRDRVDWDEVRREAHEQLGEASASGDFSEAHRALEFVVAQVLRAGGDLHNRFFDVGSASGLFEPEPYVGPLSSASLDGIGYVSIPGFGGDVSQGEQFTAEMHDLIEAEARDATCGWIIDLRENTGGNMYPMIYGLAPLLQPGFLIGFRDINGNEIGVTFEEDGSFTYDGAPITGPAQGTVAIDPDPSQQPLAILIGPTTVSSGEATAVSLASRDHTRFFGGPTGDMATAPTLFPLFDGAMVGIATVWMTGPNGAIYPDGIHPDETVESDANQKVADNDPVVAAAANWIAEQPGCSDATPQPLAA